METTTVNVNGRGSCLRQIGRKIPVSAKTEVFELAKLAGPAVSSPKIHE